MLSSAALAQPGEEDRRYRLAEGYERAGDMRGAARIYRELFDADPASELYFEAVRRTYSALALNAELLPLVEARVATRPGDVDLRVAYADLLFRAGRRDDARAQWREAVTRGNSQEFVAALVAQSQTDNRAFELAIETYRVARERSGDRLLFADQLAFLYASIGRFPESTREYLAILGGMPERLPLVKRSMASLTANPTALAAATQTVEQALERNPDFEPYIDLLSWLYDEAGNFEGAFDIAKRLDRARNGRGSAIYAYADRALREGRYDQALAALDYFLATYGRDNPLHAIALLTYARVLEERHRAGGGDRAGAEALATRYEELAEREEGTDVAAEALLRKARIEADELGDADAAAGTLEELLDAPKAGRAAGEALVLLGDLRVRADRIDEARVLYERARSADEAIDEGTTRDLARLRLAELSLYRGEYKLAVDSLTELTRNTASGITNDALAWLFLLQENFERNDAALGHYMAARLLVLQRRWSEAGERFERAAAAAPRTTLAEESTLARAQAQSETGDHAGAVEALIGFVGASPDALAADRALYRAAELLERRIGDRARALEVYTRLITEYPRSQHTPAARARIRDLRSG